MDFNTAWEEMISENIDTLPQKSKNVVIVYRQGWASLEYKNFTGSDSDKDTFERAWKRSSNGSENGDSIILIELRDKVEPKGKVAAGKKTA